jgi:hypothetical protein
MEINPEFNNFMDRYFDYLGIWESPSRCGLKTVERKDGKLLAIATELYRQNPGTPVTEWCAPLATQILVGENCNHTDFIFVEHTPDMGSKLAFYEETFDLVTFDWDGEKFISPKWQRLTPAEVERMMEE